MNTMRVTICASVLATIASGFVIPSAGQEPKFFPDDPIWVEPVTQNVTQSTDYEPWIPYTYFISYFNREGDPILGRHAKNVNTVDEVPDGPFFVNRAGRIPLTPELVARASNVDDGPAPGPWTVVSAKTSGVTPGFTIHDSKGKRWFLKFDPEYWPEMATGSEIVGAKLFWALGYHTAEYHIVRVVPSNLVISETSKVTHAGENERPMRREDLDRLFAHVHRQEDGSYRAIASGAIPGTIKGRIRYDGTRKDDPNDIVPHEHHRELRAHFVFAAWLDRVDVKRDQSIVTLVTEDGRSFLRRYILDWSSSLGSAGVRPREIWQGFEPEVERPLVVLKRAITFGALIPEWRYMPFYESPAVGRLGRDQSEWNPDDWQPFVNNLAFRHARADDKFWAAYKMTFITEDIVRAVVAEAQFGDSVAAEHLIDFIMARRSRILSAYLPAINPIVDPVLGSDGRLEFRNAAVEFAAASPPDGYRAKWSTFDNETGTATPIGVTEAAGTVIHAPNLPEARFLKVELSGIGAPVDTWEVPLSLYFRHHGGDWELVGLERM